MTAHRNKLLSLVALAATVLILVRWSSPVTAAAETPQSVAQSIIALTNKIRVDNGLPPVQPANELSSAALSHSKEMLQLDYFAHESPVPGRTKARDRVRQVGGSGSAFAENIYRSTGYPISEIAAKTVEAWVKSPGHYKNIISPKYTVIGVGVAQVGDNIAVTQVFSKP